MFDISNYIHFESKILKGVSNKLYDTITIIMKRKGGLDEGIGC